MGALAATAASTSLDARAQRIQFWLKWLFAITMLLALYGVYASYTSTVYLRIAEEQAPFTEFIQHLCFLVGGGLVAWLTVLVVRRFSPVRRWLRYLIPVAFYLSLLLVVLVMVPGLGKTVNGARRYLDLGLFVFQPSELLKISIVLYLAQFLCWWRTAPVTSQPSANAVNAGAGHPDREAKPRLPAWPALPKRCIFIILVALALTAIQPDLGSTAILLGASLITLALAGVHWGQVGKAALVLAGIGLVMVLIFPGQFDHAPQRITTWWGSVFGAAADEDGAAYQLTQSRMAFAHGGTLGRGPLRGEQKLDRLPMSTTDFVFPVLAEELGFAGGLAVILLFLALGYTGVRLANLCRDPFSRTVTGALALTLCLQALVNVGVTTGLVPNSGLTLPFFSSGGTSLVVSLLAVGLIYALAAGEARLAQRADRRELSGAS